jgi:1,4-alpha-glucan branching enzyme
MNKLTVWAPNATSVELVDANKLPFNPPIHMVQTTITYKNTSINGYWEIPANINFPLNDGDGYWFKITPQSVGEPKYRIDPYSRALQHSASYSIYKDTQKFNWSDDNFNPPSFESMVIYQLFQGAYVGRGDDDWKDKNGNNYHFTWNARKKGDFKQLKNKLDYIQSLGINTIELLPVNEYNGDNYVGYSSVSFFAIEASYGSVNGDGSSYDELKEFINEAHLRNIAVIADVVFNHIGKVGDSGPLWNYDNDLGEHSIYFSGEKAYNQAGGDFGMAPNWSKYEVQKYIEDSCIYYLEELHFDGLRFDFTSQIVNKNSGSGENSGKEVLRSIIWTLKKTFPKKIFICEHWEEGSGDYADWMIRYENFDAGWFNYHRRLQNVLQPFANGIERDLADAINGGNYEKPFNRIIYANSHDECWWDGNNDNKGKKFYPVSEFGGWRGDYWSKKKARMIYALSFFVPGIPMVFMGDEFAMEGEFNDAHYDNILNWELEKIEPGPSFKNMFKRLISIKKNSNPLMQANNSFEWLHYPSYGWFAFKRKWNADVLIVVGNYYGNDMYNYVVNTNGETGNWTQIFNSDGQEFGGDGVGNYGNNPNSYNGTIIINIPKNGIVLMARISI